MAAHVLFGADLTERSRAAFDTAYTLAKNSGGRLSVLHVADPELPSDFLRAEAEQAEVVLLNWIAPHIGDGVDVSVSVVVEDAGPAFQQACHRTAADFVVMARPRRDRHQRFFRGSTIEQVVSSVDVPVLCTAGGEAAPYAHPLLAAGLDGNDERLVGPLTMVTQKQAEAVHAVHGAYGLADAQMSYAGVPEADRHANLDDRHRTRLDRMRSRFAAAGLDELAEAVVLDTPAVSAITEAAAAFSADLAVVGFRKREGLTRLIKRPTALAVLQACPIDILVVPLPQSC